MARCWRRENIGSYLTNLKWYSLVSQLRAEAVFLVLLGF